MQGTIVLQSSRMGKAFAPCQHRHEKSRKGGSGVDLVGGPPADRHVLPNLFHEPDLPQIGDKDRHTAQRRYGTSGLAESQPLIRQQRLDLARDCIVRCFWFHPSVFSDSYLNWKTELRHSGLAALLDNLSTTWAQFIGVNPSVETIFDWHTCRSMDFPVQTTSSSPEWSSVGEAEVGSGGDQPAKE